MKDAPSDELLYEVKDGVGLVTFNRPAAHNALDVRDVRPAGRDLRHAAGRTAPCARSSSPAPAARRSAPAPTSRCSATSAPRADGLNYEDRMEQMFAKFERCPVPTIAAIPGICTGGAAVIAAACDLRIATRNMKFGFPIARTLANCLSAANITRVALLTGVGRAIDMLMTTRLIEADEALAIGLVNELFDTPGGPDAAGARARCADGHTGPADHAGRQGGRAAHARALRRHRGQGPDRSVLRQRRFSRGARCVPQQAQAEVHGEVRA